MFIFRPLVAQAILFIVVPILEPISSPKRIFGVTSENLGIMVTCRVEGYVTVGEEDSTTNTTNFNVTTASKVIVQEAFSVVDDAPLKVERLGVWLGGRGRVPEAKEHWSDRRTNLTGLHLRCATMPVRSGGCSSSIGDGGGSGSSNKNIE
ncbi:hypothetical protein E2C01_081353 [Portunus trituberculatus]|uniref:Uncharacterized protein n=1 Tax=Portunus trituberculatus TaxID=210409 RepID=A0A5B7IW35_PORTR|nr:hypothetical protein [Portunus trituberculatus]